MSHALSERHQERYASLPGAVTLVWRGLRRRCPRCSAGGLFRRWVTMLADCPRCGFHFEREAGFFLGALVINVILTELVLIGVIAIGFAATMPDPPTAKLAVVGGLMGLLAPLVFYPFTKTTWTAVDLIMRRSLGDPWTSDDTAVETRIGRP